MLFYFFFFTVVCFLTNLAYLSELDFRTAVPPLVARIADPWDPANLSELVCWANDAKKSPTIPRQLQSRDPSCYAEGKNEPTTGLMGSLQKCQNEAAHIVHHAKLKDRKRTSALLQDVGWLSINQMWARNILIETFKIQKFSLPGLHEELKTTENLSVMETRSESRGDIPVCPDYGFITKAAKLWNIAPIKLRQPDVLQKRAKQIVYKFCKTLPL